MESQSGELVQNSQSISNGAGKISTRCVIAGGGPCGVMLGYLLARSGIPVVVLERWPDFFRDFRGDTIHPSTMQNLYELGLLEKFLSLPHNKTKKMTGYIGGEEVTMADFSFLTARCPYIALLPQWDFLNFLAEEAKKFPCFKILMHTEATGLIEENGKVVGVTAQSSEGPLEIRAELVVGADGRHSTLREKSGLAREEFGVPIDVLWFRLSARESDPERSFGFIDDGKALVMLDRGDYWQCGLVIAKGQFDEIKREGLERFRLGIASLAPFMSPSVAELTDWNQVKFLSVSIDRLNTWHKPGLLLIGDAAHAMSPIGGVGINLAIQDAVAAGNILVPAFLGGTPQEEHLTKVQERREFPTKITQKIQVYMQDHFLTPYLNTHGHIELPLILRIFQKFPPIRILTAYLIGIGIRPEHVKTSLQSL